MTRKEEVDYNEKAGKSIDALIESDLMKDLMNDETTDMEFVSGAKSFDRFIQSGGSRERDIIIDLLNGINKWASEEDGIPDFIEDAFEGARKYIVETHIKPEPAHEPVGPHISDPFTHPDPEPTLWGYPISRLRGAWVRRSSLAWGDLWHDTQITSITPSGGIMINGKSYSNPEKIYDIILETVQGSAEWWAAMQWGKPE